MFVSTRWLDSHKNETNHVRGTTPNTVVLVLHFSVGNEAGISQEGESGIGGALHLADADSLSLRGAPSSNLNHYPAHRFLDSTASDRDFGGKANNYTIVGTRQ